VVAMLCDITNLSRHAAEEVEECACVEGGIAELVKSRSLIQRNHLLFLAILVHVFVANTALFIQLARKLKHEQIKNGQIAKADGKLEGKTWPRSIDKNFCNPNFSKFPQVSTYLFKFIYFSSYLKLMNCKTIMTKDYPIRFILLIIVRIILLFHMSRVDIEHWKGPAVSGVSTSTCTGKG
jgi:hypothetical protein